MQPSPLRIFLSTPSARRATGSAVPGIARTAVFLSTPSARRATSIGAQVECMAYISIHALREEGDCSFCPRLVGHPVFLSTPSARRATSQRGGVGLMLFISIHALREEGDRGSAVQAPNIKVFLSTPSARRATLLANWASTFLVFLSTPSARRATKFHCVSSLIFRISIHALREEGDPFSLRSRWGQTDFYPRPPRGGRPASASPFIRNPVFLSTPSARRATVPHRDSGSLFSYFYPRPPRGGRQF